MKNLITIFCLIAAFTVLYSCSKSSTTTTVKSGNSLIVGKWTETSDSVSNIISGKVKWTQNYPTPDGSYFQFNADGTGIAYEPAIDTIKAISIHVTYTLSNTVLSINFPAYSYAGDSFQARSDQWHITALTNNKLAMNYYDPGSDPNSSVGALVQFYYFSK